MGKHLWAPRRLSDHLVLLRGADDRPARQRIARDLLADMLGFEVAVEHDPYGKPRLAGSEVCISFSHRDGWLLIGTAAHDIGVDLELIQPGLDVARTHFSPAEAHWLARTDQTDAFTRLWTAKEAVLKAVGTGIAQGLDQPDFSAFQIEGQPFDLPACDVVHAGAAFRVSWHTIGENEPAAVACSAIRHAADTFSCLILSAPAPLPLAAHAGDGVS